jgi:polyisoprenoid-binding protein YceI
MHTATQIFDGVFESDPDHSSFEAGTRHMGVGSFSTRFEQVTARLVGDADGPRLSGSAAVESISIRTPPEDLPTADAVRTPPEMRAHVLYGEDFFDARTYPDIRFESTEIDARDDGSIELVGTLSINDHARRIEAVGTYRPPTEDPYGGVRTAIDLHATIDRRDFGLDWQATLPKGGNVLEWVVSIDVRLEFVKA